MTFIRISSAILALMALSTTATAAIDMTPLERDSKQTYTVSMNSGKIYSGNGEKESFNDGFKLSADVLYWFTRVEGGQYAYLRDPSKDTFPAKGEAKIVSFDKRWGVRAGLGYNFDHGGWHGKAVYTWFNTKADASCNEGASSVVIPKRVQREIKKGFFYQAASAKANYRMKYQDATFQLGCQSQMTSLLSLRPHYGVKLSWFDQSNQVAYAGGPELVDGGIVTLKDTCNLFGVGPHMGIESNWELGNGFSFFNSFGTAWLLSRFDVKSKCEYSEDDSKRLEVDGTHHGMAPTMKMHLGVRYDKDVKEGSQHFSASLGFEGEHWWNIHRTLEKEDSYDESYRRDKNLGMYGVTFNLGWDF